MFDQFGNQKLFYDLNSFIVIPGINEASAALGDRMISAGSATTSALALLLDSLAGTTVPEQLTCWPLSPLANHV